MQVVPFSNALCPHASPMFSFHSTVAHIGHTAHIHTHFLNGCTHNHSLYGCTQVAPRSMRSVLDWLRSELSMSAHEAAACVLQQPKLLKREPASLTVSTNASTWLLLSYDEKSIIN